MNHYSGWYYCDDCNWGGHYDAGNVVSIGKYADEYGSEDFDALVDITQYVTPDWMLHKAHYLKEHVIEWLGENVLPKINPTPDEICDGWGIGTKAYNERSTDISIWFYRRRDALKFMRELSVYKKATFYYNQNSYIKKKLNLKTNTLQIVPN
jgi:hypothetical protein